jgi:FAD/FMN-containing dehydrogenase
MIEAPDPEALARLKDAAGADGWTDDPDRIAPRLTEWRDRWTGATPLLLLPRDAAQVARLVAICAERRVAITVQGGGTGLVGGQIPQGEVLLSTERLRTLQVMASDDAVIAGAGVKLAEVQAAAREAGRFFPLSLASEGSATVGGLVSTNAGGTAVLRYGNARELVLGVEAVMPDGQVLDGLRALHKDNTGYALRHLLVGAEGTLGIITAAVLRLVPRPRDVAVALCAVTSLDAALALFTRLQRADPAALSAFEYMSGMGMNLVLRHIPGVSLPLGGPAEHYVLVELATPRAEAGLGEALETVLADALEADEIADAVVASSEAQRRAMWKLREEHAEAQKREGASVKNDVSVPVSAVPELIRRASAACERLIPGVRPVPFGHMGDGNIHMNLEQPEGAESRAFLARSDEIMGAVNEVVRALGGSFSAEHGVGRLKPGLMPLWRGGAELDAMRRIKRALDPAGIMNPGKVLPPC